jgi:hypothetical protein
MARAPILEVTPTQLLQVLELAQLGNGNTAENNPDMMELLNAFRTHVSSLPQEDQHTVVATYLSDKETKRKKPNSKKRKRPFLTRASKRIAQPLKKKLQSKK